MGREQAADLATRLAASLPPATPVYTSDLTRARETAAAIAAALGSVARPRADLRERGLGLLEGRTYAELARTHPEAVARYRSREDRDAIPQSEPLARFERRVLDAARDIALACEEAVVVTHGGVLRVLLRAALGPGKTFALGNCSCYRLEVRGEAIARLP